MQKELQHPAPDEALPLKPSGCCDFPSSLVNRESLKIKKKQERSPSAHSGLQVGVPLTEVRAG